MQKPAAAFHIFVIHFVIRLISHAGEFFAIFKFHSKSKLFCFCGRNIEKGYGASHDSPLLAGFHYIELDSLAHMLAHFFLDGQAGDRLYLFRQFLMAVYSQVPFISA